MQRKLGIYEIFAKHGTLYIYQYTSDFTIFYIENVKNAHLAELHRVDWRWIEYEIYRKIARVNLDDLPQARLEDTSHCIFSSIHMVQYGIFMESYNMMFITPNKTVIGMNNDRKYKLMDRLPGQEMTISLDRLKFCFYGVDKMLLIINSTYFVICEKHDIYFNKYNYVCGSQVKLLYYNDSDIRISINGKSYAISKNIDEIDDKAILDQIRMDGDKINWISDSPFNVADDAINITNSLDYQAFTVVGDSVNLFIKINNRPACVENFNQLNYELIRSEKIKFVHSAKNGEGIFINGEIFKMRQTKYYIIEMMLLSANMNVVTIPRNLADIMKNYTILSPVYYAKVFYDNLAIIYVGKKIYLHPDIKHAEIICNYFVLINHKYRCFVDVNMNLVDIDSGEAIFALMGVESIESCGYTRLDYTNSSRYNDEVIIGYPGFTVNIKVGRLSKYSDKHGNCLLIGGIVEEVVQTKKASIKAAIHHEI